jgi:hypothetical protein
VLTPGRPIWPHRERAYRRLAFEAYGPLQHSLTGAVSGRLGALASGRLARSVSYYGGFAMKSRRRTEFTSSAVAPSDGGTSGLSTFVVFLGRGHIWRKRYFKQESPLS